MSTLKNRLQDIAYGNYATTAARIFMGMLFLYSSAFKIMEPVQFAGVIGNYGILHRSLVPYAAIVLPSLEMILGLLLVLGFRVRSSSFLTMGLMAVFIIAISINVIRGNTFDCGCFELGRFGFSETISIGLIGRDIAFFLLLFLVFRARRHVLSLDSLIERMNLRNP